MASTHSLILCFFCFLTLYFKPLFAHSTSSFSFNTFAQNHSVFTLYGDAKVVNSSVQLTTGRITYKHPIKFHSGTPNKTVSFSTYFSFSISGFKTRDELAFVVSSNGSFGLSNGPHLKFLSVEFDTYMNGNHGLNNFVSLKVVNLSNVNLGLKSGARLQVWIDYESGSRRLEVRLNRFGENLPVNPLLFERIDFAKIRPENEGFFVGLSSFNVNSSEICNVYSWSFKTRQAPDWMHSEPLDPVGFKLGEENVIKIHKNKKNDCVVWIVFALVLGIGLGGLGSFVGMFMWMIFAKRRPVSPEEYGVKHVVENNKSLSI